MIKQAAECEHEAYLPESLRALANPQTAIPAIAKNPGLLAEIENAGSFRVLTSFVPGHPPRSPQLV